MFCCAPCNGSNDLCKLEFLWGRDLLHFLPIVLMNACHLFHQILYRDGSVINSPGTPVRLEFPELSMKSHGSDIGMLKKQQGGFISVKQNNNWMIECLPRSGQFYKIVLQIKSMEMQKSAICINSFIFIRFEEPLWWTLKIQPPGHLYLPLPIIAWII